jgi:hypothetical protein
MGSSRSFRADGTKKFGRSAKGSKVVRQHGKSQRDSQSTPSLPQSSTATASSSVTTPTASTPASPWKLAFVQQTDSSFMKWPPEIHKVIFSLLPVTVFLEPTNNPLNPTELRKLYEHIRDARGDDRAICGPFHHVQEETSTFPLDRPQPKEFERLPDQWRFLLTRSAQNWVLLQGGVTN